MNGGTGGRRRANMVSQQEAAPFTQPAGLGLLTQQRFQSQATDFSQLPSGFTQQVKHLPASCTAQHNVPNWLLQGLYLQTVGFHTCGTQEQRNKASKSML